jgi:hypothetical protein
MRSCRFKLTLSAMVVWQAVCLVMMYLYQELIGHAVVAGYTWFLGDIQASYGTFDRLVTYLGFFITTLPASGLVILLVDRLSVLKAKAGRRLQTLICWQLATMLVLMMSFECGFPYMIHQLDWWVFGLQVETYSFRNLVFHQIIAWLLCTVPISWIAVRAYLRARETPST